MSPMSYLLHLEGTAVRGEISQGRHWLSRTLTMVEQGRLSSVQPRLQQLEECSYSSFVGYTFALTG